MYISMLANGYSKIPDIEANIRLDARLLHKEAGMESFFAELKKLDPKAAKNLNVSDTQRTIRAYEVIKQTGKSILDFQEEENYKPLPDFQLKIIFLLPERNFLYETCNQRLKTLFSLGGIDEVELAYKTFGEIQTTAMKALGVHEIIQYIKGKISLDEAIKLASAKTRQYAKRQTTWFKNQIKSDQVIEFNSEKQYNAITEDILRAVSILHF